MAHSWTQPSYWSIRASFCLGQLWFSVWFLVITITGWWKWWKTQLHICVKPPFPTKGGLVKDFGEILRQILRSRLDAWCHMRKPDGGWTTCFKRFQTWMDTMQSRPNNDSLNPPSRVSLGYFPIRACSSLYFWLENQPSRAQAFSTALSTCVFIHCRSGSSCSKLRKVEYPAWQFLTEFTWGTWKHMENVQGKTMDLPDWWCSAGFSFKILRYGIFVRLR